MLTIANCVRATFSGRAGHSRASENLTIDRTITRCVKKFHVRPRQRNQDPIGPFPETVSLFLLFHKQRCKKTIMSHNVTEFISKRISWDVVTLDCA